MKTLMQTKIENLENRISKEKKYEWDIVKLFLDWLTTKNNISLAITDIRSGHGEEKYIRHLYSWELEELFYKYLKKINKQNKENKQ